MKVTSIKIWTREPELTNKMFNVGSLAAQDFKTGIESGDYDSTCLVYGSNANISAYGKLGKSGQLSIMVYHEDE